MIVNISESNYKLVQQTGYNVENFLNQLIEDYFSPSSMELTKEELEAIKRSKLFFDNHPELCKNLGLEKSREIAERVRKGESLSALLGYPK